LYFKLLALFPAHLENSANGTPGNENLARLFPLERVFDAADCVLDLSCRLVGLALRLQLGIAKHLARDLLAL
jgi:hypothetical protein